MWRQFETSFAGPPKHEAAYRIQDDGTGMLVSFMASKTPLELKMSFLDFIVEGLWRADCGELWLYSPSTGRYIEINVAPNGAWWACVFSAPRLRDEECERPKCDTTRADSKSGWLSTIYVSWDEIRRCLQSTEDLHANVTLILDGCPDVDPPLENLHSAVKLGAVDFHRPHEWVPLADLM